MNIKKVEEIRAKYREIALDEDNPNEEIRKIWNIAVDASACYVLFMSNPVKHIKYAFRLKRRMGQLEVLMERYEAKL